MKKSQILSFDFPEGMELSKKYHVVGKLGGGWEGEVYTVREHLTGIERAAKFFFPQRNKNNKAVKFYAKKLHKLRNCSILIQYLTQEQIRFKGQNLTYLISEYVEGEPLPEFIKRQKGSRLHPFQAVHLLHAMAKGMEEIHQMREYHGDLHTGNVIVRRYGLGFDLKLVDMFHWGAASPENIRNDVVDLIRVFYDSLGGAEFYAKQPEIIKDICCGLKRSIILKKFKTAGQLRGYLESMTWRD